MSTSKFVVVCVVVVVVVVVVAFFHIVALVTFLSLTRYSFVSQ